MIELTWNDWTDRERDAMMYVTNLLAWLTTTLATDEAYQDVEMTGYMVVKDNMKILAVLIMCHDENQRKILKLLQQPPEEYRTKYIANILSEEPNPVEEKTPDVELADCEIAIEEDSSDSDNESVEKT